LIGAGNIGLKEQIGSRQLAIEVLCKLSRLLVERAAEAFALGFASLAALYAADFELVMMAQRMLHAVDNFPLMAIPLFMLAGELMVKAGMMERLVAFANSLVGRVHGGLAHVTIIAGTIRSISGPGRWTRTEESFPISEFTRRGIRVPAEERGSLSARSSGDRPR